MFSFPIQILHEGLIEAQQHGAAHAHDPPKKHGDAGKILIVFFLALCHQAVAHPGDAGHNDHIDEGAQGGNDEKVVLVYSQRCQAHEGRNHDGVGKVKHHAGKFGGEQIPHPVHDVYHLFPGQAALGAVLRVHFVHLHSSQKVDDHLCPQLHAQEHVIVFKDDQSREFESIFHKLGN